MSSDSPTTLTMIYNSQLRMEKKMDTVCEQVAENRVTIEKNRGRLFTIDEKLKKVDEHIGNKKVHYNDTIANEGIKARLWRKKLEIAILTFLVTLITVGGGLFIQWLQGLQSIVLP